MKLRLPPAPIGLTVQLIANGKLFPPGTVVPFTEENLPKHLVPYMRLWIPRYGWVRPEEDPRGFRP